MSFCPSVMEMLLVFPPSAVISVRSCDGARNMFVAVHLMVLLSGDLTTVSVFQVALSTLFNASATWAKAGAVPPCGASQEISPAKAIKMAAATAIRVIGFMFLILSISVMGVGCSAA